MRETYGDEVQRNAFEALQEREDKKTIRKLQIKRLTNEEAALQAHLDLIQRQLIASERIAGAFERCANVLEKFVGIVSHLVFDKK
jgi:hypothetical protein